MIPPIAELLKAAPDVAALVGDRVYLDRAPQSPQQPYIVVQLVSSVPNNNLSELPDNDDQRLQVACWALAQPTARTLAKAVRDAIEAEYDIVFGPWCPPPDESTTLYRWSMDFQSLTTR